jgi:putative ubiquitin-RnfH superfamily antitoxin RatB of RatAB toxin-antitoxin module
MDVSAPSVNVEFVVATGPRQVVQARLVLPAGACVGDALRTAQRLPGLSELVLGDMPAGIWGRAASAQEVLKDGDRLECYRPLLVDPKVARRERFAQQGARSAGLFAKRRPGAKAGY